MLVLYYISEGKSNILPEGESKLDFGKLRNSLPCSLPLPGSSIFLHSQFSFFLSLSPFLFLTLCPHSYSPSFSILSHCRSPLFLLLSSISHSCLFHTFPIAFSHAYYSITFCSSFFLVHLSFLFLEKHSPWRYQNVFSKTFVDRTTTTFESLRSPTFSLLSGTFLISCRT